MCDCLTFRQKEYKASKGSGGADELEIRTDREEEEEAISAQVKQAEVKIQSVDDHPRSKTQPVGPTRGGRAEKAKRSYTINKKVDDFIARTKMKIRSVSGINVGTRSPT